MSNETNIESAATQGNTDGQQTTEATTTTPESSTTTPDSNLMGGDPSAQEATKEGALMDGGPDAEGKADDSKSDDTPDAPVVPEKYETFNLEKGKDIGYEFTDEQFASFSDVARDIGLTQEQAQKLVDFDIARQNEDAESRKTQEAEDKAAYEADKAANIEASKKEFGEKYPEKYAKAAAVWSNDKIVPPELRKIFNDAGFNNNQHLFRFLVNIGERVAEDTLEGGDKGKIEDVFDGTYSSILPQNQRLGGKK